MIDSEVRQTAVVQVNEIVGREVLLWYTFNVDGFPMDLWSFLYPWLNKSMTVTAGGNDHHIGFEL